MTREKVTLKDTVQEVIVKMAEGNPGAVRVLCELAKAEFGIMDVLSLDDMNIRGCQIWVGYKDHCGEDLSKFRQAIKKRDQEMVTTINRESGSEEIASINRFMR